mmetsp:Transcript_56865/g.157369  ORF Transcript_56865/g.157369 Transcript_56865/m.157369 type:complete len:260 (+) Transcript_56865:106-885(+)
MGSCWARFKAEWSKQRLDYDDFNKGKWKEVFGSSSSRCLTNSTVYQVFRFFEAWFMTFIFAWSVYHEWRTGCISYYPIFLTYWVVILTFGYFWCAWWTTRKADEEGSSSYMPFYARAAWLLQDACLPATFLVVVLYWGLLVPTRSTPPPAVGYFTHGVNFLVLILDIFLSRQPYYLLHGFVFVGLGLAYMGFSVIYWVLGGTNCSGNPYIYTFLNWNEPETPTTIGVILLFLVSPIVNFLFWFVIAVCFPGNYHEPSAA